MPNYPHIALVGRARSGKDTVAARLVQRYAYTRVAFADPLKDMAMSANPLIEEADGWLDCGCCEEENLYLADLVHAYGWERAKDDYPEIRRFLQNFGQSVRELDPDFWLNIALKKIDVADRWNLPVVMTDVRYPNELEALMICGFTVVRVTRPGTDVAGAHESETALDGYAADVTLDNSGDLADLFQLVDHLPYS